MDDVFFIYSVITAEGRHNLNSIAFLFSTEGQKTGTLWSSFRHFQQTNYIKNVKIKYTLKRDTEFKVEIQVHSS